ncbi:nicotinate-nucleotide--dimethylbenzimidazole phosphoribosyltransferase [Limoniibacter endophyticus]|uniref:Nicotinate-nucleotide--dimethylbenzimidazole phosphoribosyltransferase n=1 Tax=Limoniibacter endophyticus TaxID=1565040 RepID=A0A8J3DPX9_9HYPH|nr:nicotinate-nucleotide--dimethylbenzimidazole phosphoribosyltransferase [Limoniibacter endophyticus]GHC78492.1 nicotinate-nucleotide--dimethylbenzimidazole phosphoribosyltransferase [Limoniibacter endophyticus]
MTFSSLQALREAITSLPLPLSDADAEKAVWARQDSLTKPPRSLGMLEDSVAFLGRWQRKAKPTLERIDILLFAGSHGVTARGVSAFPSSVTGQMVANFEHGGAAINQLAALAGASLSIHSLDIDKPTGDFTEHAALDDDEFLDAVNAGYTAVKDDCDLLVLGEMGIGNTTPAAAICSALFGGAVEDWTGRGTGIDDQGLRRKIETVRAGLTRHLDKISDPLAIAAALGGRELAAILGAALAARHRRVPLLLDGFVVSAAIAPLHVLNPPILDHVLAGHVSAEAGHGRLLEKLNKSPLLSLGMRLGEGSGAATAIMILKAALACFHGMASFAEAGIQDKHDT